MTLTSRQRIHSIDVFKCFAMFEVIFIHAEPLKGLLEIYPDSGWISVEHQLAMIFCRMAVPFFFAVSGYFFYSFLQQNRPFPPYIKRIARVFICWSLFYMIWPTYHYYSFAEHGWMRGIYWSWLHVYKELILDPLHLFIMGGKYHLWFLWSLAWGACWLKWFHDRGRMGWLMVIGLILYAVDLTQKSYAVYFPSISTWDFHHGPFVSIVFMGIGYYIARQPDATRHAWTLTIAGVLVMAFERWYLVTMSGRVEVFYEFVIGNLLCAAGILKLALKYPDLGKSSAFDRWGRLTLGIYVAHMAVMETLLIVKGYYPGPGWLLAVPILTWIITVQLVQYLSRVPKWAAFIR